MDESSKSAQKERDAEEGIVLQRPPQEPDQDFVQAQKAMRILVDAGYRARLAGGCVRDRILGVRPKDYDIATDARPDAISSVFIQKSIKVVPTGIDHGTLTIVLAGKGIEITSLRRDVATDGRRAVVAFGDSYRDDAERRDFTINALYEDLDGKVYDYFDGLKDLEHRILRFVGDPATRIKEDYLRILRLFRFWARLGFEPAPGTLEAVTREKGGLAQISQERITSELMAMLAEDAIEAPLAALVASGILEQVLGRTLTREHLSRLSAYKSITKTKRAVCRLAFILGVNSQERSLDADIKSLRLSKQENQQIASLLVDPSVYQKNSKAGRMQVLDDWEKVWGLEGILDAALPALQLHYPQLATKWTELSELEQRESARRRASPPLAGQDLMKEFGLTPGPLLGALLSELKRGFREGEWNTAAEGRAKAAAYLRTSF